jgi:hypothetical protein
MTDKRVMVSIPIRDGEVRMRDLRDFVEVTDDAAEIDVALVLSDELRWEAPDVA